MFIFVAYDGKDYAHRGCSKDPKGDWANLGDKKNCSSFQDDFPHTNGVVSSYQYIFFKLVI